MKNVRIEVLLPVYYSVKRERLRFGLSLKASILRAVSAALKNSLWIPIYILLVSMGRVDLNLIIQLLTAVAAYVIIYEAGYLYTDNVSIHGETDDIRNEVYDEPVDFKLVYFGVALRVACVLIMLWLIGGNTLHVMWPYMLATLFVFYLHGRLEERYRVASFLLLRVIKSVAPYAILLPLVDQLASALIIIAVVGLNLFDVLEYGSRKLALQGGDGLDFFDIGNRSFALLASVALVLFVILASREPIENYLALLLCLVFYTSGVNWILHMRK